MIIEHRHTGQLYRILFTASDFETQKPYKVFMQLETGAIFSCADALVKKSFKTIVDDPQAHIIPKGDKSWIHLSESQR